MNMARLICLTMLLLTAQTLAADESTDHRPVKAVAETRIKVGTGGSFPLYLSRDWSKPLPDITRAVLVLHGVLRNADVYFGTAMKARAAAGPPGQSTLMIAPQFLAQIDVDTFHLLADTLRWSPTGWEGGDPAIGPTPTSSFQALDAILARLADRRMFPNLKEVVVSGHSGGGQVVQRYAIAGRSKAALTEHGIDVRYVIANPSSYAYFSAERPVQSIAASCPGYNDWKYGMERRPPYLSAATPAQLEQRYVARQVIYLLGTADINPDHPALDKSCMAEAEGPTRYTRGHAYIAKMRVRDGGTPNHKAWDVPGVGHDGDKMFTSACGLAALFDVPGCGE